MESTSYGACSTSSAGEDAYTTLTALASFCPDVLRSVLRMLPQAVKKALHLSCRFGREHVQEVADRLALTQLWGQSFEDIVAHFPALTALVVAVPQPLPALAITLLQMPTLTQITLTHGCSVTIDVLAALARLPALSSFATDDITAGFTDTPNSQPIQLGRLTHLILLPRRQHQPRCLFPQHLAAGSFLDLLLMPSLACFNSCVTLPLTTYCTLLHRSPSLADSSATLLASDEQLTTALLAHPKQLGIALSHPHLEMEASLLTDVGITAAATQLHTQLQGLLLRARHNHTPALTDASVSHLTSHCTTLRTLALTSRHPLTPNSLRLIGGRLRQLQRLSIRCVVGVQSSHLRCLVQGCPELEALEVGRLGEVDAGGYAALGLLRHLGQLTLVGCGGLNVLGIGQLVQALPELRQLALEGLPQWQHCMKWTALMHQWGVGHISLLII